MTMGRLNTFKYAGLLLFFAAAAVLAGCGSDTDTVRTGTFTVKMTNLTNNQPLSPLAAVIHTNGYRGWTPGSAATSGLEKLAEGGATADFLSEAAGDPTVLATGAGSGVIAPGNSGTVSLSATLFNGLRLSAASMLVNTNDAFTGVAAASIDGLAVGQSVTFYGSIYDAGTEENTETAATIPGPAGGGEGYNPARAGKDFVAFHGGVVTADGGLSTSVLNETHRFLSPGAKIEVTRTN
jgi:hypothetical protein